MDSLLFPLRVSNDDEIRGHSHSSMYFFCPMDNTGLDIVHDLHTFLSSYIIGIMQSQLSPPGHKFGSWHRWSLIRSSNSRYYLKRYRTLKKRYENP